jgi:hypothetical protein
VEKTADCLCPAEFTIFFGWLLILDREDKFAAFKSGTETPFKEGK